MGTPSCGHADRGARRERQGEFKRAPAAAEDEVPEDTKEKAGEETEEAERGGGVEEGETFAAARLGTQIVGHADS